MKGLEGVCGPRPAEKEAKGGRRGPAGSDPRRANRMGSGLRGPRPAEEVLRAQTRRQQRSSGLRAQTRREDEMNWLEGVCGPRPAEKGAKGVLSCWVLVRKDATKLRHLQYID